MHISKEKLRYLCSCGIDAEEINEVIFSNGERIVVELKNGKILRYDFINRDFRYFRDYEDYLNKSDKPRREGDWRLEFSRRLYSKACVNGFNEYDLSYLTGISQGTISNYMNGITIPNVYNLVKLAEAMSLSIDELCSLICY